MYYNRNICNNNKDLYRNIEKEIKTNKKEIHIYLK